MIRLGAIVTLVLGLVALPRALRAQQKPSSEWVVESLRPEEGGFADYNLATGQWTATNNVVVTYGGSVLTADFVTINTPTGEVNAHGRVRVQQGEQIWVSDQLRYNFYTHQMQAEQFRTGQPPMFAAGKVLSADITNGVYVASDTMVTSDDIAQPLIKIRAKRIKIIPGKKIVAHQATLYVGSLPVFYFPTYSRD